MSTISFREIKSLFDKRYWDIAYLSAEGFAVSGKSPIKEIYNDFGTQFADIKGNFNGIVLAHYTTESNDYSLYDKSFEILSKMYGDLICPVYTNFKVASVQSGFGNRAKNSLIYNRKFGFQCKFCAYLFSHEIVNHENLKPTTEILDLCNGCDDCITNCPVGAISETEIDLPKCRDFMSYGNHPDIPSGKWYWRDKMRPDIPDEVVASWKKYEDTPEFIWGQGVDGYYENVNGRLFKDGQEISLPFCRVCQEQPKCSKAPYYERKQVSH